MLQSHEKLLPCPPRPLIIDRRWKPTVELAPRCPRCDSANTKFCYYNNYSLTQPRYFCKGCRRYWTKGGSLRNVPVGGGCRKNRRGKSVRISSNSGGQNYGEGANRSGESTDDRAGSSAQSGSSNEATATSDASTIDLAAVYAKFLNHQPERDTGPTSVPELSGQFDLGSCYEFASDPSQQHSPVQFPSDLGLINCPVAVDDIPVTGIQFDHMDMPNISVQPERLVPEISCSDTMNYALQQPIGMPPDGIGPDISWTNCAMEPEFNWQSPLSQGFESTMEDHLNFHSNFVNCNWGVYDLPQL